MSYLDETDRSLLRKLEEGWSPWHAAKWEHEHGGALSLESTYRRARALAGPQETEIEAWCAELREFGKVLNPPSGMLNHLRAYGRRLGRPVTVRHVLRLEGDGAFTRREAEIVPIGDLQAHAESLDDDDHLLTQYLVHEGLSPWRAAAQVAKVSALSTHALYYRSRQLAEVYLRGKILDQYEALVRTGTASGVPRWRRSMLETLATDDGFTLVEETWVEMGGDV